MTELKPCPFCGSKKVHMQYSFDDEHRVIHCLHCDVEVRGCWFIVNDDELAQMWNRRYKDGDTSD